MESLLRNKFNLEDLYHRAFSSYVSLPYPLTAANKPRVNIPDGYKAESFSASRLEGVKMNAMGTPIFMPCKIGGWDLPNEPLIEISGSKSFIKTDLMGYDPSVKNRGAFGTYKENYGLDDYSIIIRGIAVNEESDDYPEKQILKIRELFEEKGNLAVQGPLFTLFNITKIVIESCRFPPIEGVLSAQPYELLCLSDQDIDLFINDNFLPS